jgi:hypothetical protein
MARLSRTTRLIVALGALALLGALGLGFTLLRPAEEENPWEFLGPADDDVTSLVFDPTTPTTLYAATRFGGVYKSEDGGATWRYLRGSGFRGRSLAIAPTTPTTLYVYGEEACTRAQTAGKPGARSTGGWSWGKGIGCLRCPSTRRTPAWSSPEPTPACTRVQTAGKAGARSTGGWS